MLSLLMCIAAETWCKEIKVKVAFLYTYLFIEINDFNVMVYTFFDIDDGKPLLITYVQSNTFVDDYVTPNSHV